MQNDKMGTLFVVATPIGNLQDITLRAIEMLKMVDRIAAEDTRHAATLLNHFSINKPTLSLHDFNERERLQQLLALLQQGESIALISDAGTPLISDPGYHLVKEAHLANIPVVPIPGPCAAIAALSVSGLPTDRFVFEGFLPHKEEACLTRLRQLRRETRTLIFYEAPHRLLKTLHYLNTVFGAQRHAVIARELTKTYESIISTDLAGLVQWYDTHQDQLRGEIVILVEGSDEALTTSKEVVVEEVLDVLLAALPLKQATQLASQITGAKKNELYQLALRKKSEPE